MICVPHEVDTDGQPRPPRRRARGRELPEHRGNDTNVLRDVFAIHTTPHDASVVPAISSCRRGLAERGWKLRRLVPHHAFNFVDATAQNERIWRRTARLQRIQAFEAGRWRKLLDAPRRPRDRRLQ